MVLKSAREHATNNSQTYFVTSKTWEGRALFQPESWARLFFKNLLAHRTDAFLLHEFVLMPDHFHLLISPNLALERAMQLIKGGFSFRAKRELDWKFDIWQPGFTDHRIRDEEDWKRHLEYIRTNPLEARLVEDSVLYEYMGFPNAAFPQGLKPQVMGDSNVRAEARTLHADACTLHAEARTLHADACTLHAEARTLQASPAHALQIDSLQHSQASSSDVPGKQEMKGTGFSPSDQATSRSWALAPEGGK